MPEIDARPPASIRKPNLGSENLGCPTDPHTSMISTHANSKVPEGHNPRGTALREALRGSLPLRRVLRGLCGDHFEGSAGLCGVPQGSAGFSKGNDPMLVTLGNCWRENFLLPMAMF